MSAAKAERPIFETSRRVEFRDTDAAGIVHFSVFFTYMEQAEHAFLRQLGIRVVDQRDGQTISWPRVAADCNYIRPVSFEDEVTIQVSLAKIGVKSVTYHFQFRHDGNEVARGHITAACCQINHGERPKAVAIPEDLLQLLTPFLLPVSP